MAAERAADLRRQFQEEGFVVCDGLLKDHAEIKAMLESLLVRGGKEADWNSPGFVRAPGSDAVQKVQGVAMCCPELTPRTFGSPDVLAILHIITGSEAKRDFFGTKFFPMFPGGTSVHWHQDNHFFGTASPHIVSCAVYLEDTDAANGCLKVVPGSHRHGEVAHVPGSGEWANGEWASVDEGSSIDVKCSAGSVVLFNALLLHAAHKNNDPERSRFSVFCHFLPTDLDFSWKGVDFSAGKYCDRWQC